MEHIIHKLKSKKNTIYAPLSGKVIHLEDIPDLAFANKMIGDGLAIEVSTNQVIKAPCNGTISIIARQKHAFVMTLPNGIHLLIHIGLNTVLPNPLYFHYYVKKDDTVKTGTPIVSFDDELLHNFNNKLIIPIIICQYTKHPIQSFTGLKTVNENDILFTYK